MAIPLADMDAPVLWLGSVPRVFQTHGLVQDERRQLRRLASIQPVTRTCDMPINMLESSLAEPKLAQGPARLRDSLLPKLPAWIAAVCLLCAIAYAPWLQTTNRYKNLADIRGLGHRRNELP